METAPQIFQASSPSRWKRVIWTGRIFFFISLFVLAIVILTIALAKNPDTNLTPGEYEGRNGPVHKGSGKKSKELKGFKDFLLKKAREDSLRKNSATINKTSGQYIRAAFYTPWSRSKSVPSLERHGDKINTIFPEWFFIDTNNNIRLQTRIDSAGLALMRKKNLRIIPMLTNYNSTKKNKEGELQPDFDGSLIHSILNDTVKQRQFITGLTDTLLAYGFSGINIDFEELNEKTNGPLTRFNKIFTAPSTPATCW